MKCIVLASFLLSIFTPSIYCRNVPFYRKDYTYVEEFDAFYKVHWDVSVSSWNTAFLTCDDEGATLFYPKTKGEWSIVQNLTEKMTEAPNVTDIFVGLHDEFNVGEFVTVDGQSTPYPLPADGSLLPRNDSCITLNIDTGLFSVDSCPTSSDTPLPFVCKKVDTMSCPSVDRGYKFLKTSKKCYKRNKMLQNWKEAMKTCFMEGGLLAVIENSVQAQDIKDNNMLESGETYFVGVRKLPPRGDFYTVKGQKFNDMFQHPHSNDRLQYISVPNEHGYLPNENGYYPNENGEYPNQYGHFQYGNLAVRAQIKLKNQDCGTVSDRDSSNLYTGVMNCDDRLPFICEMEVRI